MNQFKISTSEYPTYYKKYIERVEEAPLTEALTKGEIDMLAFLKTIPKEKQEYQYAEGKWTPKQILLHLIDTERVFAYRALQFSRSDNADLKGYDQDLFAENSNTDQRSWESLLEEYSSVRSASIHLFKSFDDYTAKKSGKVDGAEMSVRAAGYIIGGHEIHHREIIQERYL